MTLSRFDPAKLSRDEMQFNITPSLKYPLLFPAIALCLGPWFVWQSSCDQRGAVGQSSDSLTHQR